MNCAVGIDIGGQDTKIISVENGAVTDFIMNDKCSAGTGRFLEVTANTLALAHELGAPVDADPLGRYAGAIGAALCALAIKR